MSSQPMTDPPPEVIDRDPESEGLECVEFETHTLRWGNRSYRGRFHIYEDDCRRVLVRRPDNRPATAREIVEYGIAQGRPISCIAVLLADYWDIDIDEVSS